MGLMAATSTPAQAGVCPVITDTFGYGATDCNILLTIAPNGSVSSSNPSGVPNYDGSEDVLVGILNNTSQTLNAFSISGSLIFNFDGDGICQTTRFGGAACSSSPQNVTNDYAPDGVSFSITDLSNGIVNLVGGLAPGASFYFSLEEPTGLAGITLDFTPVPEPATLSLFGAALAAIGFARRRRKA